MQSNFTADLIVIGTGVAGLTAALEAATAGATVRILTAGAPMAGSSPRAQGGIAAAIGADDAPALHAEDTHAVGAGLNDRHAVDVLVDEGGAIARRLLAGGVPFDGGREHPDLGLEAGHHRRRILHAGGGATGWVLTSVLLERAAAHPSITIHSGTPAQRLLLDGDRVLGVAGDNAAFTGRAVVLATGGYAGLWGRTTNAPESRGTGLRLAWEAGAALADLEFVQFHPTALDVAGRPAFLLTEALRGEGARVVNAAGDPIIDPLLPRDVLARAIHAYRRDHGPVFLSLRHLDADFVRRRFPNLVEQLGAWELDLARDLVPIAPAAHYCMGGIRTDDAGRTGVPGLYAAGESACTGVQGANRLASNSLLECLVFGARAAVAGLSDGEGRRAEWETRAIGGPSPVSQAEPGCHPLPRGGRGEGSIGRTVLEARTASHSHGRGSEGARSHAGRVSDIEHPGRQLHDPTPRPPRGRGWRAGSAGVTGEGLPRPSALLDRHLAVERTAAGLTTLLAELPDGPDALIPGLAAGAALLRRESRGAHYRADYPAIDPTWRGRIHWRKGAVPRFEEVGGS